MNNNYINYITNIICIVLILILVYLILNKLNIIKLPENFISGFGLSNILPTNINLNTEISTLIPLNLITPSTDFKLLSLINQLKYQIVQPLSTLNITRTEKGILSKGINIYSNVILFPGNADYKLKQNNNVVWPPTVHNMNNMDDTYTEVNNNSGHFNSITTLLETLHYKSGENLHTILYDFRKFNIETILKQFENFIKNNTVIIAYDFGCVIANICINMLNVEMKSKLKKLLYICPTIGGIPLSVKDYLNTKEYRKFQSLLMSLPQQQFFEYPIIMYNSIGYKAQYIPYLFKQFDSNIDTQVESYQNLLNLSIKDPQVSCVILTNNQYDTSVSFDYNNNLLKPPQNYLPENNNFGYSTVNNNVLVGLQSKGDQVVPFSNIVKLKQTWKDCDIKLVKNKNHFSILKSYELGLLITTLI
jgi:hypothetical protein